MERLIIIHEARCLRSDLPVIGFSNEAARWSRQIAESSATLPSRLRSPLYLRRLPKHSASDPTLQLTQTFGDRILFDQVTWHIQAGQRVGLCGPNGVGKTTLLKIMAGDVEPDAGEIARSGDLTAGYLPQDGMAHEGRTLYEEVSCAIRRIAGAPTRNARA